ncbi:MAG: nicotinamide-nucleotide amidohydrolase family protein [Clostridia bacterium]|nr:nicotinamide-nucleotide amidohydrolase family protein [Clostridia bacterium]
MSAKHLQIDARTCAGLLTGSGKTIACAESCTGGLLTSAFVDIPGSSAFLIEGAVTYANDAKMRRLGVKRETLETVGAVSAECAKQMAEGIRREAGTDLGVSTTGIAGPDGGTAEKPVGLVYLGIADENGTETLELHLSGDRRAIREQAVCKAIEAVGTKLLNARTAE